MRKLISILLVIVLSLMMFGGCGNGSSKPSPEKDFDLSGLKQAKYNALGNAPKNFKYEDVVTDEDGELYIRRIQYRDGDKLKYWDYTTEKYIKDEKGAGGHFEFVKDYSKKTESDIKDDEWTYADKYDRNFYVIFIGWADTPTAVQSWFEETEFKCVKAENGVYGFNWKPESPDWKSESPKRYFELTVENGILTKEIWYNIKDGVPTEDFTFRESETMFGEVSFEIPEGK